MNKLEARVYNLEESIATLLKEHAGIKGQIRMLVILGGVIVGLAMIAQAVALFI